MQSKDSIASFSLNIIFEVLYMVVWVVAVIISLKRWHFEFWEGSVDNAASKGRILIGIGELLFRLLGVVFGSPLSCPGPVPC